MRFKPPETITMIDAKASKEISQALTRWQEKPKSNTKPAKDKISG